MIFKHYYCIQHYDLKMAGPACLATVAKQYGLRVSVTNLQELCLTDPNGANIWGLIKGAQYLKLSAKIVELSPDESIFAIPLPAITQITSNHGEQHYVVLHKIDHKGFLIADPQKGLQYYSAKQFYLVWSGKMIILTPRRGLDRANKENTVLSRFMALFSSQKKLLWGIALASLILTLFGITSAFYFKYLVDDILSNGLKNTLIIITIGLLIIKAFSQLMTVFRSQLLLYFSLRIDVDLLLQYFQHVLDLPLGFFGSHRVGEIISRSNDEQKIRNALSSATVSVLFDSVMVLAGLTVCFLQDGKLTAMTLLFLPVYFIVALIFRGQFKRINQRAMEQSAEMQSCLVDSFSGVETIKAYNLEERFHGMMEQKYIPLIRWLYKLGWLKNLQFFLEGTLSDGITILVWLVGGLQVLGGKITLGQLITFNALLAYLITPIQNLVNIQFTLQEAAVAADRFTEILDYDVEKQREDDKIPIAKIKGDIEFRNISFRYGSAKLVLDHINLKIRAGEKIALVGETGCGKTTLVKLLLGFYTAQDGEIIIDGYNIKDISLEKLRDFIGYVPQDSYLFSSTIRENIAFGLPEATLEQIIEAAKQAHIHDFIEELPLRYDTIVSERGNSLSGGQRQRISIARAILKKPDLFILDEATSNLDTITENAIHHTIDNITKNMTTLIIAHRLSTIVKCDRIIVMDKGKIIESGTHYELLHNQGPYYQSWQAQIGNQVERVNAGA